MKKLLLILTLTAAGSSVMALAKVTSAPPEERFIILRVTSARPGEELKFDASYIFRAEGSRLQNVERQTPFEARVKADYVAGIFRKASGDADLRVTVTTSADGKTEQKHVSASGDIVVVTTSPQSVVATTPEAKYSFTGTSLGAK